MRQPRKSPIKLERTVQGDQIRIRAARLDRSGPLVTTMIPMPDPIEVSAAMSLATPGAVLRALRRAHGMNQEQTAAALDCRRELVVRMERDQTRRAAWHGALAALWGTDMDELTTGARLTPPGPGTLQERVTAWMADNRLSMSDVARMAGVPYGVLRRVYHHGVDVVPDIRDRLTRTMDTGLRQ